MTHTIKHQYDEILNASLPGLEIHVVYHLESEIEIGFDGIEESNRLLSIETLVNGKTAYLPALSFPMETDGRDAQKFLALIRESARQALFVKALNVAKKAGFQLTEDRVIVAEHWQRTGSTKLPISLGKPERNFVE